MTSRKEEEKHVSWREFLKILKLLISKEKEEHVRTLVGFYMSNIVGRILNFRTILVENKSMKCRVSIKSKNQKWARFQTVMIWKFLPPILKPNGAVWCCRGFHLPFQAVGSLKANGIRKELSIVSDELLGNHLKTNERKKPFFPQYIKEKEKGIREELFFF